MLFRSMAKVEVKTSQTADGSDGSSLESDRSSQTDPILWDGATCQSWDEVEKDESHSARALYSSPFRSILRLFPGLCDGGQIRSGQTSGGESCCELDVRENSWVMAYK